jgi:hypothetical protein
MIAYRKDYVHASTYFAESTGQFSITFGIGNWGSIPGADRDFSSSTYQN